MSCERFENLEEDFKAIIENIKPKIKVWDAERYSGEERKRAIREIERKLEEASSLLEELEGELKEAPINYRNQMSSRMRTYRQNYSSLQKDLTRLSLLPARTYRDEPMDDGRLESQIRAQLLQGTEILGRTTDSIARTHRVAAETDEIGENVLQELEQQKESLYRTKERLGDTSDKLSKTRKILHNIGKRVMTNKLILCIVILLELGILAGLVYFKFFSSKK